MLEQRQHTWTACQVPVLAIIYLGHLTFYYVILTPGVVSSNYLTNSARLVYAKGGHATVVAPFWQSWQLKL